jgi:hypothetical protein
MRPMSLKAVADSTRDLRQISPFPDAKVNTTVRPEGDLEGRPKNGREAQESGPWLNASVAPRT